MKRNIVFIIILLFISLVSIIGFRIFSLSQLKATNTTSKISRQFGVDLNMHQSLVSSNLDKLLTLIKEEHITVVRSGIDWSSIEPEQNVYNWSSLDTFLAKFKPYNITILFDIGNTPKWDLPSEAHGNLNYPPADCLDGNNCQNVRSFINEFVNHIAPEVKSVYIIPRNEPQHTSMNWINGNAKDYASFLNAVYGSAHDTKHSVYILNGGEEIYPLDLQQKLLKLNQNQQTAFSFEESLYTNKDFCKSIDILDIHVGHMGPIYSSQIATDSESKIQQCNGGKYIPIWITEVNFSSNATVQNNRNYRLILGNKYTKGISSQEEFIKDTYKSLIATKSVIGINWDEFIDNPNPHNIQGQELGLIDNNFMTKSSFYTLKDIIDSSI